MRRKRGSAASGTGPNMAPHANLAEHLLECLNVVCGRFARPGDRVMNPGVLGPRRPRRAEVIPPARGWERSPRSPSGFGMLFGERMTGALVDDILAEGSDRVRALIVSGGNPAIAIPGAARAAHALRQLDLLVTIDPFLTPTARLSHYVLPPRMMLERHDVFDRTYVASANNISNSVTAAGIQNPASVLANSTNSIYAGSPRAFVAGMKIAFK